MRFRHCRGGDRWYDGAGLPVIIYDREAGQRRIVPMRWGFPHPKNPKVPQPIHARCEGIHQTKAFADAFHAQRGIVAFRTFNEGLKLPNGKTEQWTIDASDGVPRGFALVWRRFELQDMSHPLYACCMVTVPPSELVKRIPAERMPAILADEDWSTWLGENDAPTDDMLAVLKTVEGVNWQLAPEPKAPLAATAAAPDPINGIRIATEANISYDRVQHFGGWMCMEAQSVLQRPRSGAIG